MTLPERLKETARLLAIAAVFPVVAIAFVAVNVPGEILRVWQD